MRIVIPLLFTFGLLSACTSLRHATLSRAGQLSRPEVFRQISAHPGAAFLSYNGRWQGTDIDKRIIFKKGNCAEVTHFGYGVDTYKGTYSVDETGAIHISLFHSREKWPSMYLYLDKQGAFLLPIEASNMADLWPLRQLPRSSQLSSTLR